MIRRLLKNSVVAGADDHKMLYNSKLFVGMPVDAGFTVEYSDENGQFHAKEWTAKNGVVRSSSRNDCVTPTLRITYILLIIDAVRPL